MAKLGVNIDHIATIRQARDRWSRTRLQRPFWPSLRRRTASPSICAVTEGISRTVMCSACVRL